jgi:amino acid adenylation domain-containing protein
VTKCTDSADDRSPQQQRELLERLLRERARESQRAPVSSAQQRLWLIDRMEEPNPSYNIACHLALHGSVDAALLERSLNELARRHGTLRTTFEEVDGEPVQVVAPSIALPLPLLDLSGMPATERHAGVAQAIGEEAQRLFDLKRGPLIRARLLRLSAQEHVLVLAMHHIVSDGWSLGVLATDLFRIYAGLRDSREPALAKLPIQFIDYSTRQSRWLQSDECCRQLAYWTERLAGLPILDLPTDRPRPPVKGHKGATHSFALDPALSRALKQLCERESATLFMVMMAAFSVLLYRYSGQEDVVIGTPVANRNRADIEDLIGFFVNTLVMRNDLSGNPGFRELLRRTSASALAAYANQDAPFEHLVEALKPERNLGRNPLFQVAFALQSEPPAVSIDGLEAGRPIVPGYDASEFGVITTGTRVDLELHLWEGRDSVRGTWSFDVALFEAATIERMTKNFVRLLEDIVADPDARVATLPLLDETERRRLLVEWNQTADAYRRDAAVHELFEACVTRAPDAPALVFEGATLSYTQLNASANRLARYLVAGGVEAGQLVGVCLERGTDLVMSMLAIFKAGAVYVPLDPKYPESRLRYMLEDAVMPVVLSRGDPPGALSDYAGRVIRLDAERPAIDREDAANLAPRATAESLAYVIYTSGSTGKPKGTLLEHRGLCKVSAEQTKLFGAGPGHRVLQFSSPNFDASLFDVAMSLTTGATLVLARAGNLQPGPPLLELLRVQRISILTIPPSSLAVLSPEPLPDLKIVNVAGEACPAELAARWAPGRRFFNLYGPTECTIWSTANECVADGNAPHIGRAIANTKLYVLDAHGQPVPIGVPGELYIGGDGVARGYLNLPALTAEKFIANPFGDSHAARLYRTGDKVRWRADGTLEFIGRIDHQVKVRGFRIEPGEIEAVLGRQPGVRSAVVLAREDRPGDVQLVAYIVMDEGRSQTVDGLRAALQQVLPAHMIPAVFASLDALPLTPNGKVDTRALPWPKSERPAGATYVAPRSDLESGIAAIWKEVLGVDRVGVDDNFFDLGGHSLRLVKVHERVKQLIGCELPIVALFQYPTIRSLAAHLRDDGKAAEIPAPASTTQRRTATYEPIAVIGMAGRFPGAPDVDRFWQNLRAGVESIRFFSQEELRAAGIDEGSLRDPNYVPAKGYLENADLFDANFFGYSPRETKLIDPQHRLFLEVSWEALENAGYDPSRFRGAVGVYAGSSENTYWTSIAHNAELRAVSGFETNLAAGKDFLATRIAYKMDLRGPAVTVQTACSTSLVAVHEACKSLLSGECNIALAGGVRVSMPLVAGYARQENSIFSPDGHCRAFDEAAQGTLGGDGVGVVVLKRLSDAQADGDAIHAVIRGSAINNDGSAKVGYTAPSVDGQSAAISTALTAANIDPDTIGYVETHGTGTNLGDPIEITALKCAFGNIGGERRIAIGSVKTNVGHLDAAAGVAGLIKTVLALKHRELPPSLHFTKPNPKLDIEHSPFYVNERLRPWDTTDATPRRAGISSFGIGGTNAHVVLEEAPAAQASGPARAHQLLVLSARSKAALEQATVNLATALKRAPRPDLADITYTLQVGRKRFRHARIVVCRDVEHAVKLLESPASPGTITVDQEPAHRFAVFLFSGQGSQHVDMARDLYAAEPRPVFREIVDKCCEKLRSQLGCDLRELMYPGEESAATAGERLTQTRYAQPALFVIEYALAQQWMAWGIQPAAMLGHSIGEYVAACLSGVMSLDDALALVAERGRLMYDLPSGSMLSVPMAASELEPLLGDGLSIATINGPTMSVVSGTKEAVDALQARLSGDGIEAKTLHTSHAFHSPMMEPILDEFTRRVRQISLRAPQIPYVSNLTGDWITKEQATDPAYYALHLRQAVRFSEGLERLFAHPDWVLLEVGPGQTLCTLAKRHPGRSAQQAVVASLPRAIERKVSDEAFVLESLGQLWLAGVEPDWAGVHAPRQCRRVVLPTYPFERQRFWIEPDRGTVPDSTMARKHADVADWFYVPSWKRSALPVPGPALQGKRWLLFTDQGGFGERLARALRDRGANVTCVAAGDRYACTAPGAYVIDPRRADDYRRLFADLGDGMPQRILHLWGTDAGGPVGVDSSSLRRCEDLFYYSLVYLAQALGDRDAVDPLRLTVVTTQTHDVTGEEALCPEKAMVLGPCRVIGLEYAFITARNVDIVLEEVAASARLLGALLAEADDSAAADPVVAYRGSYRWVQAVERVSLVPPVKTARLREGGAYLITGGLGGMGLELATWLARAARAKLVLVARTALPPRNEWERYVEMSAAGDAIRAKIERLLAIEEAGGEVLVCSADIADREQMAVVVAAATARFGSIHGVIHAAGAAGGGVLQRQRPETVAPIFAPKIEGTRVLESLFQDNALDFMVLCSSLNTFIGLAGRTEYLSANAYLDAFAHWKARQGRPPVITVNWDTWVDVGMAVAQRDSAGLPRHEAEEGMRNEEAIEAFRRILGSDNPQIIVSVREFDPRRLERTLNRGAEPDDAPALVAATAAESGMHPRPVLGNEYVAPRNDVERSLCAIWQELLGIAEIGVHDNFFELGGDSVVSIQVIARARQKGIKLTPKQTFEHQTIAELAAVADAARTVEGDAGAATAVAASKPAARAIREQGKTVRVGNADIPDVEDMYELSPMQSGMLFDGIAVNNPGMYRLFSAYNLHGDLDIPLFRRAWQVVAARHAAIRTSIHFEDLEKPLQVVHRDVELPFELIVLQELSTHEQEERVRRYMEEERARPFDLGAAPLMRLTLFQTGPRSRWFLWSGHHILLEGWSVSIILDDVFTVYAALVRGEAIALPSTRPYRDFIFWMQQQDYAEAETFWRRQLQGFASPTPLPGGQGSTHITSAVENYKGQKVELSVQATASLEAFAREHKLTLSTLIRAAWAYLLSRYSGEHDVVFGTLVSGRSIPLEGVESIVGLFVNLVPVRVEVPFDEGMLGWLKTLHAQQGEMSQYEFCGLSHIKRWSDMTGSLPLFETLLIFENWVGDVKDWRGLLEVRDFWGGQVGQGYPVTVVVDPGKQQLSLSVLYDESRMHAGTAARLLEHLRLILEGIPVNPAWRVQDLPGLTNNERQKLLVDWSACNSSAPPDLPVHRLIEVQAAHAPDAVAVTHLDRRLTYRELNERANQLAHHLISMGVGPETIVGICLERSLDLIVGLLAILKAGGAYLPLDPKYPAERLVFMLDDAGIDVVISEQSLHGALPVKGRKFVLVDRDRDAIATRPVTAPSGKARGEHLAYVIYTSGSTGQPKGVMIEHRSLASFVHAAADVYGVQSSDRILQFATINFDTAAEEIFPCLVRGATLVLRTDAMLYSVEEFLRRCDEWRLTVVDLPTAFWHELVDVLDTQSLILPPSLRLVIIGGEAARPERIATWRRCVGTHPRLVNTYGPTEATVVATVHDLSQSAEAVSPADAVPIGRPIGAARTYVLDGWRQPVPIGATGELYIGGAGLARGYLNRTDLTAERFVPDPFAPEGGARLYRTGDLVCYREDGALEYRGRTDHQVKLRGYRIELGEIEAALGRDPSVRDAVVLFRDDLPGPPGLVAYAVPRDGCTPTVDALREALRRRLPDYMVPSAFLFLDALPVLPNGKLDRRRLPVPDGRSPEQVIVEPRTDTERAIAAIWREVLGVEKVGIHDNFFDLGGHSLLLMKTLARLKKQFQRDLSFVDLFEHTTIVDLARLLSPETATPPHDLESELPLAPLSGELVEKGAPLSYAQERFWFLQQFHKDLGAYNMQMTLPLAYAANVVSAALHQLIGRHAILRTTYELREDNPVQTVHAVHTASLPVIDISGLPDSEYRIVAMVHAQEEAAKPFDLARGPVWRALLLKRRDGGFDLIFTLHHIAADGWSMNLLKEELQELCAAHASSRPPRLRELPIRYVDYAVWHRQWLDEPRLQEQLVYWRERLKAVPDSIALPTDRLRPPVYTYKGSACVASLSGPVVTELRALARSRRATMFMTLLAAFKLMLARYANQDDIVVGTPIAGRNRAETENIVGLFLNTLVLRTDLSGNPTFTELLERVRETTLGAYGHQDLPFEKLVEALQPGRDPSRNPLFQVMFTLLIPEAAGSRTASFTDEIESVDNAGAQVDLALHVQEHEDRLDIGLIYSADLFDAITMKRMLGHYLCLLQTVVVDPHAPIGQLSMLPAAEREQVLFKWNDTAGGCPQDKCLQELFEAQAARAPDAIALVHGEQRLSYAELNAQANRLAHHLRVMGVGPDSRVAICVDRGSEMVMAMLATLKAGGAYVPLDPAYASERLNYTLQDSQPVVVLVDAVGRAALSEGDDIGGATTSKGPTVLDLQIDAARWADAPDHDLDGRAVGLQPHHLAYIIYTSGSTGRPKGVMVEHANVVRLFSATQEWFQFGSQDVWTLFHSFAFDFSVWEIWGALLHGGQLVIVPLADARSPRDFYRLLCERGITILNQTPSAFQQLIAAQVDSPLKHRLRCVIFGGEALELRTLKPWYERNGEHDTLLVNMYGITETTVHVTYRSLAASETNRLGPSPIGRRIPDLRLYILDARRGPVPIGVTGELYVGGAGVARGYLNRPELTAERFMEDPFVPGERMYKTGDLGRWLADGTIEYLGRNDFQVKIRGFRIELGEIETVLAQESGVRAVAVTVREDTPGDRRLVAYYTGTAEAEVLRAQAVVKLPAYMVPAAYVKLEALPLTLNGKLDRRALPAPEGGSYVRRSYEAPQGEVEEPLARQWAELIKVDRVGRYDNFFALGGHSLLAMQLVSRVRDSFGVELPVVRVFETQSLAELAAAIERLVLDDMEKLSDEEAEQLLHELQ